MVFDVINQTSALVFRVKRSKTKMDKMRKNIKETLYKKDTLFDMGKRWLNVPFRWHGYTRFGCDCVGLIVGILYENGIIDDEFIEKFKRIKYGTNLSKVDSTEMINYISLFFDEVDDIHYADLVLVRTRYSPIHFVIIDRGNENCISSDVSNKDNESNKSDENNKSKSIATDGGMNRNIIHISEEVGRVFETGFDENLLNSDTIYGMFRLK